MMYYGFNGAWGGFGAPTFMPFIIFGAVWSLLWMGLGLWHSAKRGEYWWFLLFLLIHTLGILEIIYLFGVCKYKFSDLLGDKK